MGIGEWISQNWFEFLTVLCGICGLWFSAFAIRQNTKAQQEETKARRTSNLLAMTANHRELWKNFPSSPELARVIDPVADVGKQPVTPAERFFVSMIIANTSSVYEALKNELVTEQEGLRRDVKGFFSLPVPRAVWSATKLLQNQDFAAFIDSSLK
jgi:hypothetical protein